MHLRCVGPIVAALFLPELSLAQSAANSPLVAPLPAAQLLKEGIALHDAEKYDEAVARYRQVLPGDSSYALAQLEMGLSLMVAEKYQESLAALQRSRALDAYQPQLYATLGADYEGLKQLGEARQAYAAGLKLYPYNENLWVNQGIFELDQNQLQPAQASLQRAIELNPTKASGHRLLGLAAARQGQISHAMLSWVLFLAIEPNGPRSQAVLINLEQLAQGIPVVEKEQQGAPVASNAAFDELDQLITAKVALSAGYTSKVKFSASIVRQLQLLVEKFPLDADPASDFWVRAYAPVIRVLRQGDNLTTFTYYILSSADDKSAQNWVAANKSQVLKMATALGEALAPLRDRQPLAGAPGLVPAWFEGDELRGLGTGQRDAKGTVVPSGDWVQVAPNGNIRERGTYLPGGKSTGKWLILNPDGSTETEQYYHDDQLEGTSRSYYAGGQLRNESTYKAGQPIGQSKTYRPGGQLKQTRQFVGNDYEGEALDYHANGQVSFRAQMHADLRDGVLETYYPDGALEQHATYAKGKEQGETQVFYPNKQLERKVSYDQDERHGTFTSYFPNGKTQETGQYVHGKQVGVWREYFADGQLSVEQTYDEQGKLHGEYKDFDRQGRPYGSSYYEHGRLVRTSSRDAAGKVLADATFKKGRTPVKAYDAEGRLTSTGDVENGTLVGDWKGYYPDGTLSDLRQYDAKGTRTGVGESYYANGQLHQRRHYNAEGQFEGYLEQYYPDGELQQVGYEVAGQDEGVWRSYYSTGQLSQERQLFRGQLSGPVRSYTPGGKLTEERVYAFGKLRQITAYDSTGQVVDHVEVTPATKEVVLHYAGAGHQVLNRAGIADGDYEGPSTWLRPDGQPDLTYQLRGNERYGPYQHRHTNGQPESEGQYLNGKLYGPYTAYYADGTPSSRGQYLAGELVREQTTYFANGKLHRVRTYDDEGNLHGPARYYNPAGELLLVRRYEHGRLVGFAGPGAAAGEAGPAQVLPPAGGPIKTTFANGKPAAEEAFAHNYPSGSYTYYYASGQPFQTGSYVKGLRSGKLVSYWPSGKLLEEENYFHDELHGRCRYYRPDGTLEREENYRAGERAGLSTTFDAQGKPQKSVYYWNNSIYNPR